MTVNVKDAKEKLGEERIEEIVDKEWKTAKLPPEAEIIAEKHNSPKARNNPNSRKNLMQYRKDKPKEVKKKIVEALTYTEVEEDANPKDFLDAEVNLDLLNKMMPAKDVLVNRKEQELYYNYINLILKDFPVDELTSSDMDDIITLALNRIIEIRLLTVGAKNTVRIFEAAPTIEKFRKHSEKIKEGLASRRSDRIDPKNRPSFSIVDLASRVDEQTKEAYDKRIKQLEDADVNYLPPKHDDDEG